MPVFRVLAQRRNFPRLGRCWDMGWHMESAMWKHRTCWMLLYPKLGATDGSQKQPSARTGRWFASRASRNIWTSISCRDSCSQKHTGNPRRSMRTHQNPSVSHWRERRAEILMTVSSVLCFPQGEAVAGARLIPRQGIHEAKWTPGLPMALWWGYGFHRGLDHRHSRRLGADWRLRKEQGTAKQCWGRSFSPDNSLWQSLPWTESTCCWELPPSFFFHPHLSAKDRFAVPCGVQLGASTCALTTLIPSENNQSSCSQSSSTFLCKVTSLLV